MQITNFTKMGPNDYELALFDVSLGNGLLLRCFRLMRSKAGQMYIKSPDTRDKRLNTEKPYVPAIDLGSSVGKDFSSKVMELLKPYADQLETVSRQVGDDCPF